MAASAQRPSPVPVPAPAAWSAPSGASPVPTGAAASPAPYPAPVPHPQASSPQAMPRGSASFGRLVAVHRNGQDGDVFPLRSDSVDIGRTEGELTFGGDRYLAARHARVERRGVQVMLRPLDVVNGVFVRVLESTPLEHGDQILLGKELFRFELVEPIEKDPTPGLQHGVHLFGSPARSSWGRLRQLTISGLTRDVLHLAKTDIVLGREEGDVRYGDDEFMSRRHAMISFREGRAHLSDLGSSNGTFVRLRGERELRPGDLFRLGDQVLRYEPT
jgi:pSer/pThr/pTyr-binding forkhead associated (FHA) protein